MGRQIRSAACCPHGDDGIGDCEVGESQEAGGFTDRELLVQGDEPDGLVPLGEEVSVPETRDISPSRRRADTGFGVAFNGASPFHLVVVLQVGPAVQRWGRRRPKLRGMVEREGLGG